MFVRNLKSWIPSNISHHTPPVSRTATTPKALSLRPYSDKTPPPSTSKLTRKVSSTELPDVASKTALVKGSTSHHATHTERWFDSAKENDLHTIRMLHKARAIEDIDIMDEDGCSALYYALHLDDFTAAINEELVLYLLNNGAAFDPSCILHMACISHSMQLLRELHKNYHIHVDTPDCHGQTPLHVAVRYGNLAAMRYLLENNADVHALYRHTTPLYAALSLKKFDIAKLLITEGKASVIPTNQAEVAIIEQLFDECNEREFEELQQAIPEVVFWFLKIAVDKLEAAENSIATNQLSIQASNEKIQSLIRENHKIKLKNYELMKRLNLSRLGKGPFE